LVDPVHELGVLNPAYQRRFDARQTFEDVEDHPYRRVANGMDLANDAAVSRSLEQVRQLV
jgi:hypothetical protein